jgi:hypothetical protein
MSRNVGDSLRASVTRNNIQGGVLREPSYRCDQERDVRCAIKTFRTRRYFFILMTLTPSGFWIIYLGGLWEGLRFFIYIIHTFLSQLNKIEDGCIFQRYMNKPLTLNFESRFA